MVTYRLPCGVEAHAAAAVAAGVDLRVVLEDLDLGVQLQLLRREIDREARDAALADLRDAALVTVGQARQDRVVRVERREVLQVDVTGGGEVRRRSDAQEAGLDLAVDLVSGPTVAVDRDDADLGDAAVDGAVRGLGIAARGSCRSPRRRCGWRSRGCAGSRPGRSSRRARRSCGSPRGRCRTPSRWPPARRRATHRCCARSPLAPLVRRVLV